MCQKRSRTKSFLARILAKRLNFCSSFKLVRERLLRSLGVKIHFELNSQLMFDVYDA